MTILDRVNLISISGGKDSLATLLLARERGAENIRAVFADTGHEHPLTYDYINYLEDVLSVEIKRVRGNFKARIAAKREYIMEHWAADGVPQEHIDQALDILVPTGIPFLDLCLWKGRFPSTRRRFCSQELKHFPLDEYSREMLEDCAELFSWQGVRRDESRARADLAEEEDHPTVQGLVWYRPILDWKAEDCFNIARRHGIDPNPLYKLGMKRVGCMPCIHSGKDETYEISVRFPEVLDKLKRWERVASMAAKRGCSTFFDARIAARYAGLPVITAANVGDVTPETHGVEVYFSWARTARGGKKRDPAREAEFESAPACKSLYGLCE